MKTPRAKKEIIDCVVLSMRRETVDGKSLTMIYHNEKLIGNVVGFSAVRSHEEFTREGSTRVVRLQGRTSIITIKIDHGDSLY